MALLRRPHPYASALDPPPPAITSPLGAIFLRHPQKGQVLLALNTLDNGQLSQQVLLDAAYVLSGCKIGYLLKLVNSTAFVGEVPVDAVPIEQELLSSGWYAYVVTQDNGGIDAKWDVVPSFDEWTFPHGDFVPLGEQREGHESRLRHWHRLRGQPVPISTEAPTPSNMSGEVRRRDGEQCVLSAWKARHSLETAHLIPASQKEWCDANMYPYMGMAGAGLVNVGANGLLLRRDLHSSLAGQSWVTFPKDDHFVAHFLVQDAIPAHFYHNVPLRLHDDISYEAIFARFAYNIFRKARLLSIGPHERTAASTESMQASLTSIERGSVGGGKKGTGPGAIPSRSPPTCKLPDSDESGLQDTTVSSLTDEEKVHKAIQTYLRSNPSVSTVVDPERMADEETWRALLDDDDYI